MPENRQVRSQSYVRATDRRSAVKKMLAINPLLKPLYGEGPSNDGRGGWVNMIRDQHGDVYRLLFYLERIPLSPQCGDKEAYEVLFGEIDPNSPRCNFPRVVYTTTGAVNLMSDGIPNEAFVRLLKLNQFEIEPFPLDEDVRTAGLWDQGFVAICIYDSQGEGLRILCLQDFFEIFVVPQRLEIQVRNEEEIVVGDTTDLKPFLLKLSTHL